MTNPIAEIRAKVLKILQKNGVKKASLFGSFARGESTRKSDVDLLIEFEGEKSLLDLVHLEFELKNTLHRKVDVHTFKSLDPLFKRDVLQQQVRLL